jgi:hypothetical protein
MWLGRFRVVAAQSVERHIQSIKMNFTHDTKYSDIPKESFLRAATIQDGMIVLFRDGLEFDIAIFDNGGRCRNVKKYPECRDAITDYLVFITTDTQAVSARIIKEKEAKKVVSTTNNYPTTTYYPLYFRSTNTTGYGYSHGYGEDY